MWRWWDDWNILRVIFRWNLWEYRSNQRKEKCDRNYSLISVQLKYEDKLIEIRLFTLQLKVWVEQWDLNLLSSDIFIDDIKNLLKIWRAHKNKIRGEGKGMYLWGRVKCILRLGAAWGVRSGVLRRVAMIGTDLWGKDVKIT